MMIKPVEEFDYSKDLNDAAIDEVSITYLNTGDCEESEVQELKIQTANNGGGRFLILETKRWAISNIEELITILSDFMKRASLKEETNER